MYADLANISIIMPIILPSPMICIKGGDFEIKALREFLSVGSACTIYIKHKNNHASIIIISQAA